MQIEAKMKQRAKTMWLHIAYALNVWLRLCWRDGKWPKQAKNTKFSM